MLITIVDRPRIRALTAEKGLTVSGLIRKSGVSQGTLLNVMTGIRTPRTDTLYKIANALGVDVKDIARWEEVEK